jgi:hypothetical protein
VPLHTAFDARSGCRHCVATEVRLTNVGTRSVPDGPHSEPPARFAGERERNAPQKGVRAILAQLGVDVCTGARRCLDVAGRPAVLAARRQRIPTTELVSGLLPHFRLEGGAKLDGRLHRLPGHELGHIALGSIVSIVGLSSETLNVCRFISRNALLESCDKIIIHDNFRSFRYRHNCVTCNQKNIYIKHMRPLTSYDTLAKLLAYARIEAGSRSCGFQSFLILFSKIIREFLVAVILFFSFRLSRIRLRELLARVIYHLSVFLILDSSAE